MSLYSPAMWSHSEMLMFLLLYYLPYLQSHTVIAVKTYDLFSEQIGTSETVYVFGGGHASQKLVPILASVDFRCVVLDDRPEFTDPALFPEQLKQCFAISTIWIRAFLLQLLIIAAS